jgi:hypothetical protein
MWRKIQPVRMGAEKVSSPGRKAASMASMKGHGQNEDANGDAAVARVDDEKREREDKRKQGLDFVGLDGEAMVGGVERLGERDEVEEGRGDRRTVRQEVRQRGDRRAPRAAPRGPQRRTGGPRIGAKGESWGHFVVYPAPIERKAECA